MLSSAQSHQLEKDLTARIIATKLELLASLKQKFAYDKKTDPTLFLPSESQTPQNGSSARQAMVLKWMRTHKMEGHAV